MSPWTLLDKAVATHAPRAGLRLLHSPQGRTYIQAHTYPYSLRFVLGAGSRHCLSPCLTSLLTASLMGPVTSWTLCTWCPQGLSHTSRVPVRHQHFTPNLILLFLILVLIAGQPHHPPVA